VTDIDALTAALEVYFSTGAKIDDARFEAVHATFCEKFAILPWSLAKASRQFAIRARPSVLS
jgi:hypothetical protein